jgi:hypothetical protein
MNRTTLFALLVITAAPLGYAEAQTQGESVAVFSSDLAARLVVSGSAYAVQGKVQGQLAFTQDELNRGEIRVGELNLTLFGVENALLTGRPARATAQGPLGVVKRPGTPVTLRYDPATLRAEGDVPALIDFAQLDELFGPQRAAPDALTDDFYATRRQPGTLKLKITFDGPLKTAGNQAERRVANVAVDLITERMQSDVVGGPGVRNYRVDFQLAAAVDIFASALFEAGRMLCLQPVRVRSSPFDLFPTGIGLPFGLPGSVIQWRKADVTFVVRDWITLTNPDWKVLPVAIETDLRDAVNVDDCIEIFFVENFAPEDAHGGGATWASGTANAKIISSDGNATFGVDITHLAHELGHVLGLGHPGNPNNLFDASTNTLMCPSGWHNDNPRRNSLDNRNNLSNPLLRSAFKLRGQGPECTANADCGACPAIAP